MRNHNPGFLRPSALTELSRALRQDLLRVRNAWEECQASRERDAIYGYLTAVFDLVAWWAAENRRSGARSLGTAVAEDLPIRRRGAICRDYSLHYRSDKGR